MSKEEASRLPSIGIEAFIRDPVVRAACRDEIRRFNIRHKPTPDPSPHNSRSTSPTPEPSPVSHDEIQ